MKDTTTMQPEFLTPDDAPATWTTPTLQLTRRSVRRYEPRSISKAAIERLLHIAASAPSAHNRQPWRFAVLRTLEHKALLANAMGERLRQDRQTDRDPNADIEADVARSFARITGAACVIVVSLSMQDMDVYPDVPRSRNEFRMAL
ncbi:MAG: nitroreductase family protein, partial [Sinobacteraceae bacterium]|nr:nitroreductase family protein [Nevskiaceae bacterium]